MDYTRFVNAISKARRSSPLREMSALLARASSNVIFLASGLPNPKLFPFKEAQITLRDGMTVAISSDKMNQALQYGPTEGYLPLVSKLKEFQKLYHSPPKFDEMGLLVTTGAQDGLCKTFEMMLSEGDYIILQEPSYPGTFAIVNPYNPKYLTVEGDKDGMKPESLRKVLSQWSPDYVRSHSVGVPKVLYLNPNGANPSGTTISLDRRKEIYKIAQDYNLLILEDDPYYFLQFSEIYPSFLSLDTDGRVIRFDSFSKILSAGMRSGYVSGPKTLLERINYHMQASELHSSNLSQVFIAELLDKWGPSGFNSHIANVQEFYKSQKDCMVASAKKWLTGLAEWNEPVAGMFLWIKVLGIKDSYSMIADKALEKNVILVPGRHFLADKTKSSPYLRASFSLANADKMDMGFKNLAELIREEQLFQSKMP